MKRAIIYMLVTVLFCECRKDDYTGSPDNFFTNIKRELKDSITPGVFAALSFDTGYVSKEGADCFVRFAFRRSALENKFILLKADSIGTILSGRIITIQTNTFEGAVNGKISISYLNSIPIIENTAIVAGYIDWKNDGYLGDDESKTAALRPLVQPGQGKVLPEVVLFSVKPSATTYTYYWLQAMIGGGGAAGSSTSGYYSSASGGSSAGGAPGSNDPNGENKGSPVAGKDATTGRTADVILVDFERARDNPAITISQYIKCFASVPDAGATFSIELFADIPVDKDPNKLFDIRTESPGHSFLQLRKTNGSQSVVQNIGFYPNKSWKSILTPAPVEGKFVDNGLHEFNAAIKMNVNAAQFSSIITKISYLSGFVKYDIDEYNCTDFALEVFNSARTSKLDITKVDVPGAQAPGGTSTPQGLFMRLKEMKKSGHAEAANITMDIVKGYTGHSTGPCP